MVAQAQVWTSLDIISLCVHVAGGGDRGSGDGWAGSHVSVPQPIVVVGRLCRSDWPG